MSKDPESPKPAGHRRRRIPRSFKDLTPSNHFNPRTFFREMVWKALLARPTGSVKVPTFPTLREDQMALTWIGHASFLVQFEGLNALIDPNFANWLFLLKRLRRPGLRLRDLPPIDLVLLTHAHFDHFHRPTLKKLPSPAIAVMPWGCGNLAKRLGFSRIVELRWWESFGHGEWRVTLVPAHHWGARTLADSKRGWGGFVVEYRGRRLYHAGDSAYFPGFREIGERMRPEVALLPIGAYYPDTFRTVHMGPDEAVKAFQDLGAKWFVPMHFGTFKLSFEDLEEPPRWLNELAHEHRIASQVRLMEEGVPERF
jgi:L-ascorbate metabolism protein UlaG (beta-lactamase superfamily)